MIVFAYSQNKIYDNIIMILYLRVNKAGEVWRMMSVGESFAKLYL